MNHVSIHLPEYVQGTLEAPFHRTVEDHLASCAACRVELQAIREGLTALAGAKPIPPPNGYFATILPRVRLQIEEDKSPEFFGHPLVVRLGLPLLAGALAVILLLHVPLGSNDASVASNPLKPVFRDLTSDQFVDVVLDQSQPLSPLTSSSEGEMSALLAIPFLGDGRVALEDGSESLIVDPVLGNAVPEYLNQLNDADVEKLVTHLGERTLL